MNSAENMGRCISEGYGYVFSQTVRGGSDELKEFILDEKGYRWTGKDFAKKSRICQRVVILKNSNGKKEKMTLTEKQVVFYSRDYDKKAKADRAKAVEKARDMERNPSKYNKQTSYGAAKYIKALTFDKKTGEIVTDSGHMPVFDEAKLIEEEKYDGYYLIVTSELKKSEKEIIEIYKGLWRIEESFRITKTDLEARPVFLSREERIKAHFLICFVALVMARLLQKRLGDKFSIGRIAESLSQATCTRLEENWYVQNYYDDVIQTLENDMGIDLTRRYMQLGNIKKIIGDTKK